MNKVATYYPSAALGDTKNRSIAENAKLTQRFAEEAPRHSAVLSDLGDTKNRSIAEFAKVTQRFAKETQRPSAVLSVLGDTKNWSIAEFAKVTQRFAKKAPRPSAVLSDLCDTKNRSIAKNAKVTQRFAKEALILLSLVVLLFFGLSPAMANNIKIANGEVVQIGADRFIEFNLSWDVSAQEGYLGFSSNQAVEIRIFAIEMVYVAEGEFAAGSGGSESGSFRAGGTTINTFQVTESWTNQTNGPCIGNTSGCLWGTSTSGNSTIGDPGNLNQAFPTGYHAFYMMKYSISQKQYVDFLNTLTRTQQQVRFSSTTVGSFMHSGSTRTSPANRNGVRLMSDPGGAAPRVFGNELNNNNIAGQINDGQWIAMNWLSWMDGAAYMDWAGLRPMTELEYEKAARGPVTPVANEYAWGTTQIALSRYALTSAYRANEGIAVHYSTTAGNANYSTTRPDEQGPIRVGIFAANSQNAGRVTAGASFWGIMELSGNLWERTVTVGHNTGRGFTALHGDGALSAAGHANVSNWPGLTIGQVTGATGSGFRGADWNSIVAYLQVSDRFSAVNNHEVRGAIYGFRGVRSAP